MPCTINRFCAVNFEHERMPCSRLFLARNSVQRLCRMTSKGSKKKQNDSGMVIKLNLNLNLNSNQNFNLDSNFNSNLDLDLILI